MNRSTIRLAQVLSELFPDVASTQRIMASVGMEASRILGEQSPLNRWYAIVNECEKAVLLPQLVAAAMAEYPEHSVLRAWGERTP
jgi:hypothetical protein